MTNDESRPPSPSMSMQEIQQLTVRLLTARNDSRKFAHEQLDAAFPALQEDDLPTVARDLHFTLVALLEFVQEVRDALRADDAHWDDYFKEVIQRFALE